MNTFTEVREVRPVRIRLYCECGAEMEPTGAMLASNPPWYPHKCTKCEYTENMRVTYPHIEYIDINGGNREQD